MTSAVRQSVINNLIVQLWRDDDFACEETLRPRIRMMVFEIQGALRTGADTAADLIEVYFAAADRCRFEPLATPYDLGRMQVGVTVADVLAGKGNQPASYAMVKAVRKLLAEGHARRAAAGVRFRPTSEVRMAALLTLARLKWEGSDEDRDTEQRPESVVCEFFKVARTMYDYMGLYPTPHPQKDANYERLISLANVEVCKMAMRFCPGLLTGLVDFYNRYHRAQIDGAVGFYRDAECPACDLFWDWELCKLDIAGQLDANSFGHCYAARRKSLGQLRPDILAGTVSVWQRQAAKMKKRSWSTRAKLEVVGG